LCKASKIMKEDGGDYQAEARDKRSMLD